MSAQPKRPTLSLQSKGAAASAPAKLATAPSAPTDPVQPAATPKAQTADVSPDLAPEHRKRHEPADVEAAVADLKAIAATPKGTLGLRLLAALGEKHPRVTPYPVIGALMRAEEKDRGLALRNVILNFKSVRFLDAARLSLALIEEKDAARAAEKAARKMQPVDQGDAS